MDSVLQDGGYFVLRTPALGWDVIEDWARGVRAPAACNDGSDVAAALQSDVILLRDRLRTLVKRQAIQNALFLASPDLFRQLGAWLDGDASKSSHVEGAVVRYLMRMAGRATPFGLFAGTSVGTFSPRAALRLPPASAQIADFRLDTEFVYNLADCLAGTRELGDAVRYRPNDAAYEVGGRLRYYEPHVERSVRTFRLVDVHLTPHLNVALNAARGDRGATKGEIAESICAAFPDAGVADAMSFIDELVSTHILRSAWSPALTGIDPALDLLATLAATPSACSDASTLCNALRVANELERPQSDGQTVDVAGTATILSSLYSEVQSAHVLRVDLRRPGGDLTLSRQIVSDIHRYLLTLARISDLRPRAPMSTFIRHFQSRYQASAVPLLQALDEESGVGFDTDNLQAGTSPLLADIRFALPERTTVDWTESVKTLFHRLAAVLGSGATKLELSDMEIEALATEHPSELPSGVSVLAAIAATSSEALERGDYRIYLRKAFGPNSAKLLARFCQRDPELHQHVMSSLRREEASEPDAIHAEVVHLPHYQAGNAICRPVLRDYEIPLFVRSGADPDRVISLHDLLVSVEAGSVVLRSQRLGRRVVPHLTCAHAFRKSSIGLYRFLASLEEQGTWSELAFTWGPLASAPYLPQVVYERCVFALAQWTIQGSEFQTIARLSAAGRFRALQDLRHQLRLPRFVSLVDADNALPIDFDNALSLESFINTVEHRLNVVLSEVFPPPGELVVHGDGGRFQHELIVPFVRASGTLAGGNIARAPVPRMYDTGRKNHPGSRWLFVTAYCGAAVVDRVLTDIVAPFVDLQRRRGAIDCWFFVRSADPQWHVRVRFRGEPSRLWAEVAPAFLASLANADGLVDRTVVDTYDREEERYGGPDAMDIAERVFQADSEAALAITRAYSGDLDARFHLALYGMDALMTDFGLSLEEKTATVQRCYAAHISIFADGRGRRRKIGERYRSLRSQIEALFSGSPGRFAPGLAIIQARSLEIVRFATELRQIERSGGLAVPFNVTVESYLHMWANRVLRSAINPQEIVLYDFLRRLYQRPDFGFAAKSVSGGPFS